MGAIEIVNAIGGVLVAVAASIGAYVACQGLGTWKKQLRGQSEYELARRLLVSLFKFREAINGVRHPAMWPYEMPEPPEGEAKNMDAKKIRFYGTSKAYEARWEKVQLHKVEINTDLLEAEAIWGAELNNLFKSVFTLEHELFTSIRHFLELSNPERGEDSKEAIRKLAGKKRDIMYDCLGEEPDDYKREMLDAISSIERYLKPHLGHK